MKNNIIKTAIIIQGATDCENIATLKKEWEGTDIIFSTWKEDLTHCYTDENDVVIYNTRPEIIGVGNLNLQRVSSLNGFLKAKELGYDRVVKWRYDLIPFNSKRLLELFKEDFINFYGFHDHNAGYIIDYFMEGDVDDMINLFTFSNFDVPHAEVAFTNRMFELGLDSKANFICKQLEKDNVDVYWKKYNFWLSQNSSHDQYKTYTFKK
jgi:hypothetical protein